MFVGGESVSYHDFLMLENIDGVFIIQVKQYPLRLFTDNIMLLNMFGNALNHSFSQFRLKEKVRIGIECLINGNVLYNEMDCHDF